MRVVILRSNPVLPDPRVEKETNSLLGFGFKVHILAWNRSAKKHDKKDGKLQVQNGELPIRWFNINATFGNGMRNLLPLILFQVYLIVWLIKNQKNYDVIHACDFDTVIPAWLCSRLLHKKYVYDIFDYYVEAFHVPKALKRIVEKLDIGMINAADAVIIVNESRISQISKSKPKKLYIIHNSPDAVQTVVDDYTNVLMNCSLKPRFAYIGILGAGRLLKEIIDIFKVHPEWELHLGGYGIYEDYIKEVAAQYDNVFYYGRVLYKTAIRIEDECDVLFATYDPTIPNHRYSSPNKLYEAMMLGKPIIVAKGTGIDVFVESENLGLAINYCKSDFESAIHRLLNDKQFCESIREKAKELYVKKFSWSIMSKRLSDMYKSI